MKANILLPVVMMGLLGIASCNTSSNKHLTLRNEGDTAVIKMGKSVGVIVGVVTNGEGVIVAMNGDKIFMEMIICSNGFSLCTTRYETNNTITNIITINDGNGDGLPEWRRTRDESYRSIQTELFINGTFRTPIKTERGWMIDGKDVVFTNDNWVYFGEGDSRKQPRQ